MRLTFLGSGFIFNSILPFQNGSSFFLFLISFTPNNWVISNAPHLTSVLSSVMLVVCNVTSVMSLYQFFLGFGSLASFLSSLTQKFFQVWFVSLLCQYCRNLSIVLNFLHLSLSSSFCAICSSVTFCIGSVLFSFAHLVELQHYFHHFL